ncbi:uncharacterized protein LOC112516356 [Cynara cardunculus var. scolymus]|uniref:Uncharacterized protein n=1 Tax=Cynara cardunculus var. scolymus TaxID=59895 RepID=A0A118JV23_CYNCS|nr:uncharacterized protein LOC112516356 [Cynara cardunculus var. scolymus]KVH93011.1 hypothetical protein Ccrd_004936 [Cynara cardunculus var. scolymus]
MASKAKKLATIISFTASRIFFFLIFFQIPLFRFPCRIGTCRTPMELTSSQLIATEVVPSGVVKALLYPGAIGKSILNKPIPKYNKLLDAYKLKSLRRIPSTTDLQYIEVLAGSYLAVAGSIIGLFRSRRLGLFGMLLLCWGLSKEPYGHAAEYKAHRNAISVYYPTMSIAVLSAFLSIRDDVKKIVSCFRWTFSKSKYK